MFRLSYERISVPIIRSNPGLTVLNACYLEGEKLNENRVKKVFLGIHGNPGSSKQFKRILPSFIRNDFKSLVPDFPGFGETKNDLGSYGLTTKGRATFLSSFLHQKSVESPDVALSFSSASFTTIQSLLDGVFRPGAIVLASPNGFRSAVNLRPLWFLKAMANVDSLMFYTLYSKVIGLKMPPEIFSSTAKVAASWDYEYYREEVKSAKKILQNTPFIIIYGTKDKLFEGFAIREFAETLGVDMSKDFLSVTPKETSEMLDSITQRHEKLGTDKFCIELKGAGHTLMNEEPNIITDLCCVAANMS